MDTTFALAISSVSCRTSCNLLARMAAITARGADREGKTDPIYPWAELSLADRKTDAEYRPGEH